MGSDPKGFQMDPALPSLQLTKQERDRFATYLEMEAKSDFLMAQQMLVVNPNDPMMKTMASKYRAQAIAATIVAQNLRKIEEG